MAFDYCCFISYPHGQEDVLVPIVTDLATGLKTEIYAQIGKKVWVDHEFLQGGQRQDQEIGPDLCRSACMILVFTPLYFDSEHIYCARELKAMRDLEEQRLELLDDKGKGLIIPIVLRGEEKFPRLLKTDRLYYDFTNVALNTPLLRVKLSEEIKTIAAYIVDRCERLDRVAGHLTTNCEAFALPGEEDVHAFVETVLGSRITDVAVPFPSAFRSAGALPS